MQRMKVSGMRKMSQHQDADEFKDKRKDLERTSNPVISKKYEDDVNGTTMDENSSVGGDAESRSSAGSKVEKDD
ncbi:hypothetical protein HAX54_018972 [Datura stramonium]|uniref:Uncharacterized protein n=1 Tax=Datura stramonium TaxID=4076 RepID=A0ABS8UNZ9_DATST|nr:hypothetical protein [Datura stramonium]